MPKEIYQGDSYETLRPFFTLTFLNDSALPLDLSGYTVRTTFKLNPTDPASDPNDANAYIKHHIAIGLDGSITSQQGLFLRDTAADGIIDQRLNSEESGILPIDEPLYSDVELTTPLGEKISWVYDDPVIVRPAYTNRNTDT